MRLDPSAASRRAREAIELGYLENLEERKGKQAKYVIGNPMPDEIEVLPSTERLEAHMNGCTMERLSTGARTPLPPEAADIGENFEVSDEFDEVLERYG